LFVRKAHHPRRETVQINTPNTKAVANDDLGVFPEHQKSEKALTKELFVTQAMETEH
jgi:hypothetical protein